ncbi:MAG: tetratricopeptide repeat protein [Halomonas sp.]|nr:tetratricopeptide repeat protein [Halomonas sp.]MCC5883811.1 tetratricopeptide repeat protein [Halomonas sp.]
MPPANGEPPAHYLERADAAVMEAPGDEQQLTNALAILDQGLERHPDDTKLRSRRANLLTTLGRYEEARQDLDTLHDNTLNKEGMLLRCMVYERLEGDTEKVLGCYAGAEVAFVTNDTLSDQPDANHILAARLAESPEAEALLLEWQASNGAGQEPMLGAIMEMDREKLIRQFLP